MKPKLMTFADAVYTAINQIDGGSEHQIIKRASKLCGKAVTLAQFKKALASFDHRGVGAAAKRA